MACRLDTPVAAPGFLVVRPYESGERKTEGGIVLPALASLSACALTVINNGGPLNNNQFAIDAKPGDAVLVRGYKKCGVEYTTISGEQVLVIPQEEVLAVVKNRVTGQGPTLAAAVEDARDKIQEERLRKKLCA